MMPKEERRGGYRPGAGAKKKAPLDAKRRVLLVTDEELQAVRELVDNMREKGAVKVEESEDD